MQYKSIAKLKKKLKKGKRNFKSQNNCDISNRKIYYKMK